VDRLNLKGKKGKDYKEILAELQERLKNYDDEEGINKLLNFQQNFRKYSFQNCLMILFQYPDATRVAGFKAWNKMGRKVKKGETGIRIFAPCLRNIRIKTKDDETNEVKKETVQQLTGFRLTSVFDIAQTEGEEVTGPSLQTQSSDHEELYHAIIDNSPIPVMIGQTEGINRETKGYFAPASNHIKLSQNLQGDNKLLVLIHELAHYYSYAKINAKYENEKNITHIHEIVAEGATHVFCHEYQVDTRPSYQYLYSWTQHGQKNIIEYGELIRKTANKLIELATSSVASIAQATTA